MNKPFATTKQQKIDYLDDITKPIEVYKNLRQDCWSVRQNGIVKYHCHGIVLKDAEFKVSQSGRNRVLRKKQKNVHAVVKGYLEINPEKAPLENWIDITYNPYKYHSFVRVDTVHSVRTAEWVDLLIHSELSPVIAWGVK